MLTRPDALNENDRLHLKAALANCADLAALAEHVRSFAHMLTHLQGDQLPEWMGAATVATELPSLRRFAQHLERDLDAVIAGLSQPWNPGVVEGHVNRIKILKREMFGRAGFELLRKRVLLYAWIPGQESSSTSPKPSGKPSKNSRREGSASSAAIEPSRSMDSLR
ncbi:transposase (plasmid) [Streptomyces sp. DSM 116494]|uniref:transposase n=1 Tax=Streptomyces okerensis TaxID=3344655 RepID=UPI00388D6C2A